MIQKMIVKSDGVNLIGRIREYRGHIYRARMPRTEKSKRFDKYYYEAQYKSIPEKEIPNYIQARFIEDAEDIISDTITDVEFSSLYKNFLNRLHKRLQRYREKLNLGEWNYFVTFTYDDKKETPEGFEKRLKIAFNNLAKRNGWRIVGGWENGELGARLHFHAIVYVPEGKMIGELFLRNRYSEKKRRNESYTENSYFFERFGMSDWVSIDKEDLTSGHITNYLVKYVAKSGRRLFYSRGIPHEFECDVDTEKDVFCSFFNFGMRFLLAKKKKAEERSEALEDLFEVSDDVPAFELAPEYAGFTRDLYSVPIVR